MNIKTFIATLVLGVSTIAPVHAQNNHDDHRRLWNTLQSIGITTILNEPTQCNDQVSGAYGSSAGILIVCQDNSKSAYSVSEWTQNDYDTLRHEAHHVVQDCADNRIGDNNLVPLFSGEELEEFVSNVLTDEQVDRIVKEYRSYGVSDDVVIAEIEAFAVARSVSADAIANKLIEFCSK